MELVALVSRLLLLLMVVCVRVWCRRVPTSEVCHPSVLLVKPLKKNAVDELELWENHGVQLVCFLC